MTSSQGGLEEDVVSDVLAGYSSAGSTFLCVSPPLWDVGGDDELCALGAGAAVVHHWLRHDCHTDKRTETGARGVGMCYSFLFVEMC